LTPGTNVAQLTRMRWKLLSFRTPVLAGVLAATGCSGGARPIIVTETVPAAGSADRARGSRMAFTEEDARFASALLVHQTQAIEIANLATMHGAGAGVQTLARRIVERRTDVIDDLQRWLTDRRQPVPAKDDPAARGVAASNIPGMLTADQIRQLEQAIGADFDRLFLSSMIQHQRGALSRVRDFLSSGAARRDTALHKLVADLQPDQTAELARMEQMLAALPARAP
jgi:uncharacterized protein (DUF305 family)